MAGGGELRYLEREKETEQTQSCRGDLPKCRQKKNVACGRAAQKCLGEQDQWASPKAPKLRADLDCCAKGKGRVAEGGLEGHSRGAIGQVKIEQV